MSWKPEVQVFGEGDTWHQNQLRFATQLEAIENAQDLMVRWTLVRHYRAVESEDPVNYTYHNRVLQPVTPTISSYNPDEKWSA